MSELTDVLAPIESLSARGEKLALATIVAVRGSTYRRPGARLLVPEEGAPIGNISGGCLESDVADVARIVMAEGHARVVSFDLTADDDAVWGWGLGCNGAIELFVEPADKAAEVAGALRMALERERPICMVTVLDAGAPGVEQGNRLLVTPEGETRGSLGAPETDAAAVEAARELLAAERSEIRDLPGGVRAFVEVLEPPLRLVICGAGHDAVPLVAAAANLGWSPIVVDDRPAFLTRERFPQAAGFVALERPDRVAERAPLDERTFAVVMTHNFLRDKDYLRALLASPVRSISMLGPHARTQRLLHELREEGLDIGEGDLGRLRAPAGLDLGAEGPEEIAAAIVAEIVAVKRGRRGGFLRDRPGPIHDRPARPAP
ncbi:putative xanthine dehydrogenase subunit A [bacterium HR12]|nr:putative xanthine dehydrogenase subunit A [bacterium HR12]